MIVVILGIEWCRRKIREDNWVWDKCDSCGGTCWIDGSECKGEYKALGKWEFIGSLWDRCWWKPWSWFIPYEAYWCEVNDPDLIEE